MSASPKPAEIVTPRPGPSMSIDSRGGVGTTQTMETTKTKKVITRTERAGPEMYCGLHGHGSVPIGELQNRTRSSSVPISQDKNFVQQDYELREPRHPGPVDNPPQIIMPQWQQQHQNSTAQSNNPDADAEEEFVKQSSPKLADNAYTAQMAWVVADMEASLSRLETNVALAADNSEPSRQSQRAADTMKPMDLQRGERGLLPRDPLEPRIPSDEPSPQRLTVSIQKDTDEGCVDSYDNKNCTTPTIARTLRAATVPLHKSDLSGSDGKGVSRRRSSRQDNTRSRYQAETDRADSEHTYTKQEIAYRRTHRRTLMAAKRLAEEKKKEEEEKQRQLEEERAEQERRKQNMEMIVQKQRAAVRTPTKKDKADTNRPLQTEQSPNLSSPVKIRAPQHIVEAGLNVSKNRTEQQTNSEPINHSASPRQRGSNCGQSSRVPSHQSSRQQQYQNPVQIRPSSGMSEGAPMSPTLGSAAYNQEDLEFQPCLTVKVVPDAKPVSFSPRGPQVRNQNRSFSQEPDRSCEHSQSTQLDHSRLLTSLTFNDDEPSYAHALSSTLRNSACVDSPKRGADLVPPSKPFLPPRSSFTQYMRPLSVTPPIDDFGTSSEVSFADSVGDPKVRARRRKETLVGPGNHSVGVGSGPSVPPQDEPEEAFLSKTQVTSERLNDIVLPGIRSSWRIVPEGYNREEAAKRIRKHDLLTILGIDFIVDPLTSQNNRSRAIVLENETNSFNGYDNFSESEVNGDELSRETENKEQEGRYDGEHFDEIQSDQKTDSVKVENESASEEGEEGSGWGKSDSQSDISDVEDHKPIIISVEDGELQLEQNPDASSSSSSSSSSSLSSSSEKPAQLQQLFIGNSEYPPALTIDSSPSAVDHSHSSSSLSSSSSSSSPSSPHSSSSSNIHESLSDTPKVAVSPTLVIEGTMESPLVVSIVPSATELPNTVDQSIGTEVVESPAAPDPTNQWAEAEPPESEKDEHPSNQERETTPPPSEVPEPLSSGSVLQKYVKDIRNAHKRVFALDTVEDPTTHEERLCIKWAKSIAALKKPSAKPHPILEVVPDASVVRVFPRAQKMTEADLALSFSLHLGDRWLHMHANNEEEKEMWIKTLSSGRGIKIRSLHPDSE